MLPKYFQVLITGFGFYKCMCKSSKKLKTLLEKSSGGVRDYYFALGTNFFFHIAPL